MKQYLDLVKYVLDNGDKKTNRTGINTLSVFGYQTRYDLREGFPLVTTKKVIFDSVVRELLWFIKGSTNIKELHPCRIWDAWADKDGELGPVYGSQWRKWKKYEERDYEPHGEIEIDQLSELIANLKEKPDSRRHIISAWNVAEIEEMALPPCHCLFQFNVANGFLDCQLYQRSADILVGVPFNIASYALLTLMIANEVKLTPRYFIHSFGDAHIYENHIDGAKEQLTRKTYDLPEVQIENKPFFDLVFEDFKLVNYKHHPFIKFDVAV